MIRQPGMTGQVKEEILTRWGELGVRVHDGRVSFDPQLLQDDEFFAEPTSFSYIGADGQSLQIPLPAGSLAFTFCQVPVIYTQGDERYIVIKRGDGSELRVDGDTIQETTAAELFGRIGRIERVTVHLD